MRSVNYLQILSVLDLTRLNSTDTALEIDLLCQRAILPQGHVAAICVLPAFVKQAAGFFKNTPVKIAAVANFPSGSDELATTLQTIINALQAGADEIDVVFPYQAYLAGNLSYAEQYIVACKQACKESTKLKVILETGALSDTKVMQAMAYVAIRAGADFLKTSTGKIPRGATLPAAAALLDAIKATSENRAIGLKVSGGIRNIEQGCQYVRLVEEVMGPAWVNPATFRIGTSQLLDKLCEAI